MKPEKKPSSCRNAGRTMDPAPGTAQQDVARSAPCVHEVFPKHHEERNPLKLLDLKQGDIAIIHRLTGGRCMKARMDGFGIREGTLIRLIMTAPFHGPLLVEDVESGARIMIGRGMAESVEVSHQEPS